MTLRWKTLVIAAAAMLVVGFDTTAAHASTSAPNWGCTKHPHDRTKDLSGLNEDGSPFAETDGGIYGTGADANACLCVDSYNNGWYWAVQVKDTIADGKCAHAAVHWHKSTGEEDIDYGMWVSTRNGTRYEDIYLSSFIDGEADNQGGWYYYVPDLL